MKAIIFDLNGVLIASEYLSARFEKEFGVPNAAFVAALKEVMDVVRKPDAPKAFDLWKPYLDAWNLEVAEEEFFTFWFSGESVVTETLEYIKKLKTQGVRVFILSNNFRERTEYYRTHCPQIFENIDHAYFSWETGFVKPSRGALLKVLEDNHLRPKETLYFDDSEINVVLAQTLGIKAYIWINLEGAMKIIDI